MGFANRHIDNAAVILSLYTGELPLAAFLKQYFAQHKKFGSKDRKHIAHACYCYFRLGRILLQLEVKERIRTGIYLCSDELGHWQEVFTPDWLQHHSPDLAVRCHFIQQLYPFEITTVFPFVHALSNDVDIPAFCLSHLVQPDLFLRARPGKEQKITEQLTRNSIAYTIPVPHCITVANNTKLEDSIAINRDAVIQDLSSQRIAEFLQLVPKQNHLKVWDCCAASGGKSILAVDVLGHIELTVSDIRPSIIHNLQQRFAEAGIKGYRSFVADLSSQKGERLNVKGEKEIQKSKVKSQNLPIPNPQSPITTPQYNLIICDAPCSGSGTWGRTPEQLYSFEEERIQYYADLQKNIAANAVQSLIPGGHFLYITCSVFAAENEDVVAFIQEHCNLQLIQSALLKGYDKKADTMFAALFTSPA
jgi:16S rRNA (cytosine967-C5)-methyltransferase